MSATLDPQDYKTRKEYKWAKKQQGKQEARERRPAVYLISIVSVGAGLITHSVVVAIVLGLALAVAYAVYSSKDGKASTASGTTLASFTPGKPDLRLPHDSRLIDVRGESYHMPALEKLVTENGVNLKSVDDFDLDDLWLRLIPEPTNTHDPQAVQVASSAGELLGYLSRENAAKYTDTLTELATKSDLWCAGQIGGGLKDDGWSIGVWLYMVTPSELAKQASQVAAQSIAALNEIWRGATDMERAAREAFDTALAQMQANATDPDGEAIGFARANIEKAIRSYVRATKALDHAVQDFAANTD